MLWNRFPIHYPPWPGSVAASCPGYTSGSPSFSKSTLKVASSCAGLVSSTFVMTNLPFR